MPSERVQRQIDRLLDEAEAGLAETDWALVRRRSEAVLSLDPENADALSYIAAAARGLGGGPPAPHSPEVVEPVVVPLPTRAAPASFGNGRYRVERLLGEGGRKLPQEKIRDGFLAAAAVGYLCKHNATLSGAEGGCQAEIGVASAMGAAFIAQACLIGVQTRAVALDRTPVGSDIRVMSKCRWYRKKR